MSQKNDREENENPEKKDTFREVANEITETEVKKLLEDLVKEVKGQQPKKENLNRVIAETSLKLTAIQEFAGPVPHPRILEAYNRILPGSAEKIFKDFEEETYHRREIEKKIVDAQIEGQGAGIKERKRGQNWAGILVVLLIISATVCALNGAESYAKIIGGTTIVGLAVAFIIQNRSKKKLN